MRKLLFALLICRAIFTSTNISGQGYIPFPENDAVWTLYYAYGPDVNQDRCHIHYALGDTMIAGQSYNKLYKKTTTVDHVFDGIGFVATPGTITSPKTYLLAYRNDSLNKMVYKIDADSTVERPWYNFGLQIGDTIPGYMLVNDFGADTMRLVDIDTINYCGTMRKKYILSSTPCYWLSPLYFIEGVGNDHDFTRPLCGHGEYSGTSLECFIDYDYCGLPLDEYSGCNIYLSTEYYEDQYITIYPNPSTDKIYLKESMDEVYISDIMGRQILNTKNVSVINVSEFTNGIYYISAIQNGKKFHSSFIKQ